MTRREDLSRLAEELERVREAAEVAAVAVDRLVDISAPSEPTSVVASPPPGIDGEVTAPKTTPPAAPPPQPPQPPSKATSDFSGKVIAGEGASLGSEDGGNTEGAIARAGSGDRAGAGAGVGAQDEEAAVAAAAVAQARGVSRRARRDARQAREDTEVAEEALRRLRMELEGLTAVWTDRRTKLLGEQMEGGGGGRLAGVKRLMEGGREGRIWAITEGYSK